MRKAVNRIEDSLSSSCWKNCTSAGKYLENTHNKSLPLLMKDSLFRLQVSLIERARPTSQFWGWSNFPCQGTWGGDGGVWQALCPLGSPTYPPLVCVSESDLNRDGNVAAMLDRRAAAQRATKEAAASVLSAEQLCEALYWDTWNYVVCMFLQSMRWNREKINDKQHFKSNVPNKRYWTLDGNVIFYFGCKVFFFFYLFCSVVFFCERQRLSAAAVLVRWKAISFKEYYFFPFTCKMSWKLKSPKSAPRETPLSDRKRCSWNASPEVPPLIP